MHFMPILEARHVTKKLMLYALIMIILGGSNWRKSPVVEYVIHHPLTAIVGHHNFRTMHRGHSLPLHKGTTRSLVYPSPQFPHPVVISTLNDVYQSDVNHRTIYGRHSESLKSTTKWTCILALLAVWLQWPTSFICSLRLICSSGV